MDTSILIQFIEAERATIDPKHRSLECDKLAYGIISRVLNGLYGAKREAEKAEEALLNPQPVSTSEPTPEKVKKDVYGFAQDIKQLGISSFEITCGICGERSVAGTSNARLCKKRECRKEYMRRMARKSEKLPPKTIDPERIREKNPNRPTNCLNCGEALTENGWASVCNRKENPKCGHQVKALYTAAALVKHNLAKGFTITPGQRLHVETFNRIMGGAW